MDAVEIFLLCVLGFSVLVFLFVDSFDPIDERRKKIRLQAEQNSIICDFESKTRTGSFFVESAKDSDDQEEKKSVGADIEAEKQVVSENFMRTGFQEIEEEEEEQKEIPVISSSKTSCLCCGLLGISETTIDDICSNMEINEDDGKSDGGKEEYFNDWEGIERTELEKIFGKAVVFVGSKCNADQIDGDVKLQLYGLQKIALEEPCHGSQPTALKVSARAKWNAWQKLGSMSREMAMENYINILSDAIPGWKDEGALAVQDAGTSEDQTSTLANKYGVQSEIQGK